jgi:hypothetical protein
VDTGYAPPPPVDPSAPASGAEDRVAISSVQLLENCPDAPAVAAEAQAKRNMAEQEMAEQSRQPGHVPRCEQSTVQLAVRSTRAGRFKIEAVRVLDGARQRLAGSTTLRQPTHWNAADSSYRRWDERVVAGPELQISYKLGDLDLSRAEPLVGADFNTFSGPFMLELEVSIDDRRQTIRSAPFVWQRMDMVET